MQASNIPAKFIIPFANSAAPGYIRTVPVASQIGVQDGAASFTDGFVPANFVAVSTGGVPPFGQDFNGLLNAISAWSRWNAAGVVNKWDSAFSTAIGGYPAGAFILNAAGTGFWLSTTDNNTTNPDAAGAGWVAIVITASNSTPLMDGSATAGSFVAYARGDHRHPTDTTRLAASYLSSDTGKVAAVASPGLIVVGHAPKFTDSQGTIGDGYAYTGTSGSVTLTSGTHVVGRLIVATNTAGSTGPGPALSNAIDAVVVMAHGVFVPGNVPVANDATGTIVDSGFSISALLGSNDALKYQLRLLF